MSRPLSANGKYSSYTDADLKFLKDPIHGHIPLSPCVLSFIDTPHFQRLRDLKQLGVVYFVFPGASHNRFEHSIGVSYLSGLMLEGLCTRQPTLEVRDEDISDIRIAGLCHDLGHGPYSHLFDNVFMKQVCPGSTWTHEDASNMMLTDLIDKNYIDINEDRIKRIQSYIHGNPQS